MRRRVRAVPEAQIKQTESVRVQTGSTSRTPSGSSCRLSPIDGYDSNESHNQACHCLVQVARRIWVGIAANWMADNGTPGRAQETAGIPGMGTKWDRRTVPVRVEINSWRTVLARE